MNSIISTVLIISLVCSSAVHGGILGEWQEEEIWSPKIRETVKFVFPSVDASISSKFYSKLLQTVKAESRTGLVSVTIDVGPTVCNRYTKLDDMEVAQCGLDLMEYVRRCTVTVLEETPLNSRTILRKSCRKLQSVKDYEGVN